jgi:glycosyltransferase involved in cell wall biosynthesis
LTGLSSSAAVASHRSGRVGFFADGLQWRRMGAGNYAYHLIRALPRVAEGLCFTWLFNYFRKPQIDPATLDLPRGHQCSSRTTRVPGRWLHSLFYERAWPAELVYGRHDVLHSPDFLAPLQTGARVVLTVPDLIDFVLPRDFPEIYGEGRGGLIRRLLPKNLARAEHVIAISESTANDLSELFDLPRKKISVVYYGIDPSFRPLSPEEFRPVLGRYGIGDRPYVLLVGRIEHRKNHVGALSAFRLLKRQGLLPDHQVVLCGAPGTGRDVPDIMAEVEALGGEDLLLTQYVAPEDMPAFYSGAEALLFPTFYEGFGLPALEAMACGLPVTTSNVSSMPEVVGDAGYCVDPSDVEGMAEALWRSVCDDGARRRMSAAGIERARGFTWEKAARETVEVYRSLL